MGYAGLPRPCCHSPGCSAAATLPDQTGNGPPLVLVSGALNGRAFGLNGPLAAILAGRFTVVTYDQRGRG